MRSSWGRVGVGLGFGLGLVVVVAACGGGSDGGDVEAAFGAGEPGRPVGDVVVGGEQAWVVGQEDRSSATELWRLEVGSAEPEHVGTAPALQGASHRATGDGLELAGWRCADGEMPGCEASVAELVRVDAAGAVTDEVVLAEKPGPLDPSDSVAIVGATSRSTWVAVEGSIVEVRNGEVVSTVESAGGEHCVIDDRLYALVDPEAAAATAPSATSTAPATETTPTAGSRRAGMVSTFVVQQPAGGGWRAVPGGGPEALSHTEPLTGFCGDGQFEVTTPGGTLVAVWRPGEGWSRVRAAAGNPPAEGADAAGAVAVEPGSPAGRFARRRDGEVVERASDGTYAPTGLDLRPPSSFDPGSGPVVVSADSSDTLVAACVTWPVTTETATTSCDVARR